jgi:uncharacterized protein YkwD
MRRFSAVALGVLTAIVFSVTSFAQTGGYTISHTSGTYSTAQIVQINPNGEDVYYTTDGSAPTEDSELYVNKPIVVTENTVIRTATIVNGKTVSADSVIIKIKTASPKASAAAGTYNSAISVKLSCSDNTAEIYYTTDGSTPTKSSKKYTAPISISETTTLKFAAYGENRAKSSVVTRKYTIDENVYSDSRRQELFELVNKVRAEYGLSALEELPALSEIAQTRAKECSTFFSHYRSDGTKWDYLLSAAGLKRNTRAENIAYYYTTAQSALNSWMNDYSHRKNILNPNMKYIGIGYYNNGSCGYWTQIFLGDD